MGTQLLSFHHRAPELSAEEEGLATFRLAFLQLLSRTPVNPQLGTLLQMHIRDNRILAHL